MRLDCPRILSFEQQPDTTAAWMMQLRKVLTGKADEVVIDHRPLEFIGSAAALVLIAEMYRGNALNPRMRCKAWLPVAPGPQDLLGEIGYYKYFPKIRWGKAAGKRRFYLEHLRGETVDGRAAQTIQQHLLNHRPGGKEKYEIYNALIEGMNNACEWGYECATTGYRSWWALGYRDEESGEIAYSFYDQGCTIPKTIRGKVIERAKRRLGLFDSSKLIEHAVVKGRYSRTGKANRGSGLPALKRLIDKAGQGRMLLMSREALLQFLPNQRSATRRDLPEKFHLHGTLISWLLVPRNVKPPPHDENDLFSQ